MIVLSKANQQYTVQKGSLLETQLRERGFTAANDPKAPTAETVAAREAEVAAREDKLKKDQEALDKMIADFDKEKKKKEGK